LTKRGGERESGLSVGGKEGREKGEGAPHYKGLTKPIEETKREVG